MRNCDVCDVLSHSSCEFVSTLVVFERGGQPETHKLQHKWPISACVRIGCSSLMITSLPQVVYCLDTK